MKQRLIPDFSELSKALESICTTPMDEGDGQPRVTVIQLDKEQGPLIKYLSQSEGFQVMLNNLTTLIRSQYYNKFLMLEIEA